MPRRPSSVRRGWTRAALCVLALGLLVAPVVDGRPPADGAAAAGTAGTAVVPTIDGARDWPAQPPPAGTPAGTVLRPMAETTVTRPGTVIKGRLVTGMITVAARDVLITASRIAGAGDYGVKVLPGASARITHTTITGFDNAVTGDNYTADYVEATALRSDGFKLGSHVVVANSWCHDMTNAPGEHPDCAQLQSGEIDVTVRHNWLDIGVGNSALFISPTLGPSSPGPVTLADNVVGGGNYTVYCVDGAGGRFFVSTIRVIDNWFLPRHRYGPTDVNVPVTWRDNRWRDTGLPVLL